MIDVEHPKLEKQSSLTLKSLMEKTCPHCGSIRTHEYKTTRHYLCGTILTKPIYGMSARLVLTHQCKMLQEVKAFLRFYRAKTMSVNYLTEYEADLIKLNTSKNNIYKIGTCQSEE